MKITFLTPYPESKAPSQRFRFEQHFQFLKEADISFQTYSFLDNNAWKNIYKTGSGFSKGISILNGFFKRVLHLLKITSSDYVFIHREITPIGPPIFEWVIAKILRKRIIYDFDDAIWLNDPNEKGILSWLKWKSKISSICKWSYKVSCGNEYLMNYALQFNKNVVYNPTTIDTKNQHNGVKEHMDKEPVIIGWTGTHTTLYYLNQVERTLKNITERQECKLLIIANRKPNLSLEFEFIKWSKESEIEDLLKIDIGIMPLTDDQWSEGKCGFKALQYMALGIPTIASPVGVNSTIIDSTSDGYLAESKEEWENALIQLIEDVQLRKAIGLKGREKVESSYSVESNKNNFLKLFS
ncbi:MAG: glycosyltransferase [Bacteroidota bacterium]